MADGDITTGVNEVKPDVTNWSLDTVLFLVNTKTCKVTYNKRDSTNASTGEQKVITFRDIANDPDTPEDESSTEFTQLVQAINNGNNIKNTITAAVKIKLGI